MLLLEASGENGNDIVPVGDDADVRMIPDRRAAIGVDREHRAGRAYADRVIELARQTDRDIEARGDAASGDADLARPRLPSLVGDLARRRELCIERVEQRL